MTNPQTNPPEKWLIWLYQNQKLLLRVLTTTITVVSFIGGIALGYWNARAEVVNDINNIRGALALHTSEFSDVNKKLESVSSQNSYIIDLLLRKSVASSGKPDISLPAGTYEFPVARRN